MADRPIIFSAPMVRAILDGRKTQTRRVLKPQPEQNEAGLWVWPPPGYKVTRRSWRGFCQTDEDGLRQWFTPPNNACDALPFAPGDRLWVREAWQQWPPENIRAMPERARIYRADTPVDPIVPDWLSIDWDGKFRWRSPIHMPRWASRLTLTVTDVRVQRVQDISEADARAECADGVCWDDWRDYGGPACYRVPFRNFWNTIHGCDAWDRNDWVAPLTFTAERRNIDAGGADA